MQFKITQGCRQGAVHFQNNIDCQDAIFAWTENGLCIICLADGAGSCDMSQLGAEAVTRSVGHYLCSHFAELYEKGDDAVRLAVLSTVNDSLRELSDKYGVPCEQFASTLLFAATDAERYICGHLGDGCIICLRNDTWNVLSFPQNGDSAQSTFLTGSPLAGSRLRVQVNECGSICGFILISDGIMPDVFSDNFSYKSTAPLLEELSGKINDDTEDDASFIACVSET